MAVSIAERRPRRFRIGKEGLRTRASIERTIYETRIETTGDIRRTRIQAEVLFRRKYGKKLAEFAIIYSHANLHKDGYICYGNAPLYIEEVVETYSEAFATALSRQPEDKRAQWITGFFTDLSSVVQFNE